MQPRTRQSGFASMDQEKQREIAHKGGKAAHEKGTAHEFNSEEARQAGRKGGQRVSANRDHMIEIGRLGGMKSAERRRHSIVTTVAAEMEPESDGRHRGAPAPRVDPDAIPGAGLSA